ncbi:hypothetical protein [Gordonia crocea]|uniref:hypothetical protein n=1 Tax=Gordonia crocea TaxID=589162 RepID=UPI00137A0B51|nr:hypothetical protein [Gordonia crocea]
MDKRLRDVWELHGLKLEGHMASCVEFLLRDDRWTGLKRNDDGHSHHRVLDVYVRMQAESDEGLLCSAQPTWTLIG